MNSNKRMTIDELILWCKDEAMHHEDSHDHERASGYRRVMKFITDNKSALERGMQKPLRLKVVNQSIASNMTLTFYELEYGTSDKPNKVRFNTPDSCEQFASFLNLPCEFIEDTA